MGAIYQNGKPVPITPWQGSWAQQEEARRRAATSKHPREVNDPFGQRAADDETVREINRRNLTKEFA